MLDLYFGLDASGFEKSSGLDSCTCTVTQTVDNFPPAAEFHNFLGPVMMVTYACLSNTLLLTGTLALGSFSKPRLMLVQSWFP